MSVKIIASEDQARCLARDLNDSARTKPYVVVTTPAREPKPFIDSQAVDEQVGDLADVFLISTGPHSWAFSDSMPALTQVYGGAGRAYPVGSAWVTNPYLSPLRFAWDRAEGHRAADDLVADALRMAGEAGLLDRPGSRTTRVRAVVEQLVLPSRAMVKTENHMWASVWQELLFPDVEIDRVLSKGMLLDGVLDLTSRRYDARHMALPAAETLAGYCSGMLVLAEVVSADADVARVRLHPDVEVVMSREDVTSNELDEVSSLMTRGEVLPVRVLQAGPAWHLSVLDVDDDEEPRQAPALLRGGPPWLAVTSSEGHTEDAVPVPDFVTPETDLETVEGLRDDLSGRTVPAPRGPAPNPLMLDPRRRAAGAPDREASLRRDVQRLEEALARAATEKQGLLRSIVDLRNERQLLHHQLERSEEQSRRLGADLKRSRAALRGARQQAERAGRDERPGPLFLHQEEELRHDVYLAWVNRFPAAEKADRPLSPYAVGPNFLRSMDELDGIDRAKIVDVVVEVLTGVAKDLTGRDLHPLRISAVGNAANVTRPDGATCWRVALQVGTPQARRLHYWQLRDGTIELSRVGRHDDFTP